MKMITAIIQPFMLSKVTRALEEIEHFPGMTVLDAQGFGREKADPDPRERYPRMEDVIDFVRKVRIEIVAQDAMVGPIIDTIYQATHTGNRGDGKIFVLPVEHALRIKTGQAGEEAI